MNELVPESRVPQLVVFDMAGTTVSDDGLVVRSFDAAYDEVPALRSMPEGAPRSLEELRQYALGTMGQSKIAVFTELTGDTATAEAANEAFERAYARFVAAGEATPIPGAVETFRTLRAQGIAVVLTTGFSRQTQNQLLDQLGWHDEIDFALVPADAGRGRPWPDLNLCAVIKAQVDAVASLVVVGDTVSDMLSGARAGAGAVVGVLTGGFAAQSLTDAGATSVIESVAELPALLGLSV